MQWIRNEYFNVIYFKYIIETDVTSFFMERYYNQK